ncbi:MAG: VWA domain-containing protein [Planctomycetota bacterium]|nr:MAG: VWA domain-containing protein [Planctomycetota bacterium]
MDNFTINNPWLLLTFPAAAGILVALFTRSRDRSMRAWVRLILRTMALALLACALADFTVTATRRGRIVVFAADQSSSHKNFYSDAFRQIHEIEKKLSAGDRFALVRFAEEAVKIHWLVPPLTKFKLPVGPNINPSATDIASAIDRAVEAAEGAQNAAIVIFTDGKATQGDAFAACVRARASGCKVHFRAPDAPPVDDVTVELLSAPHSARVGEPFNCHLRITSTKDTTVKFRLFHESEVILVRPLRLVAGIPSVIAADAKLTRPGFSTFKAVIDAATDIDADKENSSIEFGVASADSRNVLVISRKDSAIFKTLEAAPGIEAELETENDDPASLSRYQAIVLDDVPAGRIGAARLIELKRAVTEKGCGLVVFGGSGSYAAGGYAVTPLEELLPVWPQPKERKPVTVAVCLDASGSMAEKLTQTETKFQAAAAALFRLLGAMTENDHIAVYTFNREPALRIELTTIEKLRQRESELRKSFAKILPNGGTNIYTALSAARKSLGKANEDYPRHVILLSDGVTEEGEFDQAAFNADNVSITSIATGGASANFELLKNLAVNTRGRYYRVNNLSRLGEIFLSELSRLSGKGIRTKPTGVNIKSPVPGFAEKALFPKLNTINRTHPKKKAEVLAVTDADEPVIARWRLGLGMAYAAPFSPEENWKSESNIWPGTTLVRGLVRAAAGQDIESYRLTVGSSEEGGRIKLAAGKGSDLYGEYSAVVTTPGGSEKSVPLKIDFPGEFSAVFPTPAGGTYGIITFDNAGNIIARGGLVVTRPSESPHFAGSDYNELRRLAEAGGGKLLLLAPAVDDIEAGVIREPVSLFGYFLLFALLAYLVDLGLDAIRGLRRRKSNK